MSVDNSDWLHRAPTARAGPSPGSRRLILTAQLEVAAGAVPGYQGGAWSSERLNWEAWDRAPPGSQPRRPGAPASSCPDTVTFVRSSHELILFLRKDGCAGGLGLIWVLQAEMLTAMNVNRQGPACRTSPPKMTL